MTFRERLQQIYEETKEKIEAADNVDTIGVVHESVMDYYCDTMIPQFFSSEGEGSNIKDMYAQLRQYRSYPFMQTMVESVDLNVAGDAYKEYIQGMRSFITDTCDMCIDGEIYAKESASCEEKLNTAKANDGLFIASIFGGSNNERRPEPVLESVKNVEFLIDFLNFVRFESAECGIMIEKIKKGITDHPGGEGLLVETAKLMTESMNDYVYHVLDNVFQSYDNIHMVLEHKGLPNQAVVIDEEMRVW